MATKSDDACRDSAEVGEPVFTLLGRDISAPALIEAWADTRAGHIAMGMKPDSDNAKVKEARECAKKFRAWRAENR